MNPKAGFVLSVIVSFSLFFGQCKNAPTEPEKKSPREYTWTIDTLAYPGSYQTAMRDMWASSPSDVYVTGHNDGGSGKMYHFNGSSWLPIKLYVDEGGLITNHGTYSAIHGFSSHDIFAVGFKGSPIGDLVSQIIHFNGTAWTEQEVTNAGPLHAVWGSSPTDVWAAGYKGTLLHYNGATWSNSLIDSTDNYMQLFGFSSNQVYLLGERIYSGPPVVISKILLFYNGLTWARIDSLSFSEGTGRLGSIGSTLYAVGEGGAYAREASKWILKFSTPSAFLTALYSSEESNAFTVGTASAIYHCDGNDWAPLQVITGEWWLQDVWCTDREAFIVGHDYGGYRTIILHGK
jgi:hypothetical protein